jgi:2-methylcitrate dehydratase PrpD
MKDTLAQQLGRSIAKLEYGALPREAVAIAKMGLSDCVAVMIAGSGQPAIKVLSATLAGLGGPAEATLHFSGRRMPAPYAAWINGAAAHVLDYDDVAKGHPSAVIVPALLAEAEVMGATGARILTAYVAGYEVWMDLVTREPDNYQMKGLHPTSLLAAVAAAGACANLRKLDAPSTTHALGIAAIEASGLTASYGTMTKSMQVGRAAHNGIMAARLAAAGMNAAPDTLDHDRGFLRAISPNGKVDVNRPVRADGRWHIVEHGLSVKRYPACYCAHRAIDGALELRAKSAPKVADIERIEVTVGKIQASILKNSRPHTAVDAIFSAEFAVSAALIAGNVGLQEMRDDFVTRPDVQALLSRVQVLTTDERADDDPTLAPHDRVRVVLRGGDVLDSGPVRYPLGNAKRPMQPDDLRQKFMDCISAGNPALDADYLWSQLQRFESIESCHLLYGSAAQRVSA